MASYRKIYFAVLCDDEDEARQAQKVAEDLSVSLRLSAKQLIAISPALKKNGAVVGNAFRTIATQGKKGLLKVLPGLINMKL